jgi:MYXO-CTERM domain-containing protein
MSIAKEIHDIMVTGSANAYVYWWIPHANGLTSTAGDLYKRAYVLGQFAKHIRPGYFRVETTSAPATNVYVSAYAGDGKVVIVAVNSGTGSVSQKFNLESATVAQFATWQTSASANMLAGSAASVSANSFTFNLPAQSITTFVGTNTSAQTGTGGATGTGGSSATGGAISGTGGRTTVGGSGGTTSKGGATANLGGNATTGGAAQTTGGTTPITQGGATANSSGNPNNTVGGNGGAAITVPQITGGASTTGNVSVAGNTVVPGTSTVGGASSTTEGNGNQDDGGCSCRLSENASSRSLGSLGILLGLGLLARRRSRRS